MLERDSRGLLATWPIKRENNRRERLFLPRSRPTFIPPDPGWNGLPGRGTLCLFHGAHNPPIKYISGARPSVESKRRICAMERATSARRRVLPRIYTMGGRERGRAELFEQKRDDRTRPNVSAVRTGRAAASIYGIAWKIPHAYSAMFRFLFFSFFFFFFFFLPGPSPSLVIVGRPSLNRLRIQPCNSPRLLHTYHTQPSV